MSEYNFDGKIRAISRDYCFMGIHVNEQLIELGEAEKSLTEIQSCFLKKYAEYVYQFDKSQALELIFDAGNPGAAGDVMIVPLEMIDPFPCS